jgi:hypothetical protein
MKLPKQSAPVERFAAPSVKSTASGVEASSFWDDAFDVIKAALPAIIKAVG